MKKQTIAFVLLLCLAGLAGCGPKAPGYQTEASPPESQAPALPDDGPDDGYVVGALIREDGEGLVSVFIWEDGRAELLFDLERWDNLHGVYDNAYFDAERISEGPFSIVTAGKGRVKDACVGKIEDAFGYLSLRDFISPTVILLMEDGSLEYLQTDPFEGINSFDGALYSQGKLPWLKDVESLSYENDGEGIGEMTIFARDKAGLIYNTRNLIHMTGVFDDEWLFRLDREGFSEWRYCVLRLFEDGGAAFETGLNDGFGIGDYGVYEGSYEISLAENAPSGRRPGLISFDMTMTGGDAQTERISGAYFIQARDGITLELWHSDGGHLAYFDGEPVTEFYFFRPTDSEYDFWGREDYWDDEAVISYLLEKLPDAREKTLELGMAALCDGGTTELNGVGLCRDVWLGTNHPEQFTREILYTVSGGGDIYEYDPVDDLYHLVYAAETSMSVEEAGALLRDWLDGHPFQLGAEVEPESGEYALGGEEYYRFYLSVVRFGVVEVLANKETGALFHLASPGNDEFEPLDDYYYREHGGY